MEDFLVILVVLFVVALFCTESAEFCLQDTMLFGENVNEIFKTSDFLFKVFDLFCVFVEFFLTDTKGL